MTMASSEEMEQNTKELRKLREVTVKRDRFWRVLSRGMVTGIGTALGATIMAAMIIAILVQILRFTGVEKLLPENLVEQLSARSW